MAGDSTLPRWCFRLGAAAALGGGLWLASAAPASASSSLPLLDDVATVVSDVTAPLSPAVEPVLRKVEVVPATSSLRDQLAPALSRASSEAPAAKAPAMKPPAAKAPAAKEPATKHRADAPRHRAAGPADSAPAAPSATPAAPGRHAGAPATPLEETLTSVTAPLGQTLGAVTAPLGQALLPVTAPLGQVLAPVTETVGVTLGLPLEELLTQVVTPLGPALAPVTAGLTPVPVTAVLPDPLAPAPPTAVGTTPLTVAAMIEPAAPGAHAPVGAVGALEPSLAGPRRGTDLDPAQTPAPVAATRDQHAPAPLRDVVQALGSAAGATAGAASAFGGPASGDVPTALLLLAALTGGVLTLGGISPRERASHPLVTPG